MVYIFYLRKKSETFSSVKFIQIDFKNVEILWSVLNKKKRIFYTSQKFLSQCKNEPKLCAHALL